MNLLKVDVFKFAFLLASVFLHSTGREGKGRGTHLPCLTAEGPLFSVSPGVVATFLVLAKTFMLQLDIFVLGD